MRAGRLDRIITIQRSTWTASDSGEDVKTWSTLIVRRRASLMPVRGEERFSDPQLSAREQVEFRVRYSQDVAALTARDRIVYPALSESSPEDAPDERNIYDIHAVHEIGRREGLRILTSRRPDIAP